MDTSISQLAALQELDRQCRWKTELAEALEAEVAELEERLRLQRHAAQSAAAEKEALEARRREMEAHLYAEEAKMKDRRMRLNRVRNEKELQALRREIEAGKEANQQVEEEVLGVLEALEGQTAAANEAARALAELEQSAEGQLGERRARIAELLAEAAADRQQRTEMVRTIDAALLRKYEQIFERRGGTAVVEVRGGTCQGCHMHLPPQFFNELQRSREMRLCPSCHRILFWRSERLEPLDSSS